MVKQYWRSLLALGLFAGCSYYYEKGGVIDQAVLKDIAADAKSKGMHQCDEDVIQETCPPKKLAQCRADCDRLLQEKFRQ